MAACLAGVFSREDALALVAARGRWMQGMPPGSMLAIPLPEAEARLLLNEHLSLAAVNGPSACVISGPSGLIDNLEAQMSGKSLHCRHLHTSHAFHSEMMGPMMEPFAEVVRSLKLNSPKIPWHSRI